ncbi:MAG: UDP-N-acetylmuramoyl-L-alanine--D-glutamate ligase [Fastidiosipila sp.]|nr:UDP-N-acetylmuramoyl-L-alanine--D-glutamate ligase [Fastidiosipila sp.]
MNYRSLDEFRDYVKNKKIAVLGVGISNRPLIRWLSPLTEKIHVFDRLSQNDKVMQKTLEDFAADGLELNFSLGPDYLDALKGFDLIFRTPHMRPDLPQLVSEKKRGARITSEMELFLELCPAPVTAVTGSDGKTTTTALISNILEQANHRVFTGGNIGTPLLDQIEKIKPSDQVVVELSSFQLLDLKANIHTAVVTNLTPNHLDFHLDFAEYSLAKKNIFRQQNEADVLVLNAIDKASCHWAKEAQAEIRFFNCVNNSVVHSWLDEQKQQLLVWADKTETVLVDSNEVLLPGRFNLDNVQAAVLATLDYASFDHMRQAIRDFRGVPHRLEWIRKLDGADWYNSSIDTSPDRTIKTLEALHEQGRELILIAGGKDKNSSYDKLGKKILESTSRIIFIGENSLMIEAAILAAASSADLEKLDISHCNSYHQAISYARQMSKPGDAIVLSPAGTSYDSFRHFEERGDLFRKLIQQIR